MNSRQVPVYPGSDYNSKEVETMIFFCPPFAEILKLCCTILPWAARGEPKPSKPIDFQERMLAIMGDVFQSNIHVKEKLGF